MQNLGIHSVAIKTSLEKLSEMKQLYVSLLGGKEVFEMPGCVVVEMPNQCIVELYTEIADTPSYLFQQNEIVLGFRTENLQEIYEKLKNEHIEMLSPIQHAGECYSFFHFLNPSKQVCMMNELHKH